MAKRVRALAKPELLVWARESAGYEVDEAAKKLQQKPERLAAWESEGDVWPTINQLRTIARVYRRPLSVFYLQEVPRQFQVLRDFRRLPGDGLRRYSPELMHQMRLAQQRRRLALELLDDIDEAPVAFELAATLEQDPEALGADIRRYLDIPYAQQVKWRDGRVAFNTWRGKVEAFGVLVFQMESVAPDEVSGFAISEPILPVIAVSKKNTPFARRTFSLLHELTHLMLRESGVSDLDVDAARPPEDQRVEVFCNHVAAATLMPRERFLAEEVMHTRSGRADWPDDEIEELAKQYSVSREAVVRRLLTFDRTTEAFYQTKRDQYGAEREAQRARERARLQDQDFRRNPPQEALKSSTDHRACPGISPGRRLVLTHDDGVGINQNAARVDRAIPFVVQLVRPIGSPHARLPGGSIVTSAAHRLIAACRR